MIKRLLLGLWALLPSAALLAHQGVVPLVPGTDERISVDPLAAMVRSPPPAAHAGRPLTIPPLQPGALP